MMTRRDTHFDLHTINAALARAQSMAKLSHAVINAQGEFLSWSDTLPNLLGVEEGGMPRSTREWMKFVHPDDRERLLATIHLAEKSRTKGELSYRLKHVEGHWLIVRQIVEPLEEGDGTAGLWFNTIQDITEQETARSRLAESRALLQAVVDSTSDFIFVKDMAGYYRLFNRAAADLFGRRPEDVVGANDFELFPPDEAERIRRSDVELVRNGRIVTEEFELDLPGRGRQIHLTTKGPIFNDSGEPIGLFGIARDITTRKREEAQALEDAVTRAELVRILQHMTTVSASSDDLLSLCCEHAQSLSHADGADVEIVEGTDCVVKVATGSLAAFVGHRFGVTTSLSGRAAASGQFVTSEDTDIDDRVDREACRATGVRSMIIAPFRCDGTNGLLKVVGASPGAFTERDITHVQVLAESLGAVMQRQAVRSDLEKSEAQYRLLFTQNPQPMWVYDTETLKIIAVNRAATLHYGYTEEEFLNLTIADLRPSEDVPALLESVRNTPADARDVGQWRHVRKDGSVINVEISSDALQFNGKPGRLVMASDITRRVALEEQLRQSQKMEAIGTLAGGIAHDFNNILASILGNAQMALEDVNEPESSAKSVRQIELAAQRGRELVRQIMAFSRREPALRKPVDLCGVIEEAGRLLRATLPPRVSLQTRCPGECIHVLADAGQLNQVLMNLGTNASQAMAGEPGLISVELKPVHFREPVADITPPIPAGKYACISVEDTGKGMAPATMKRIFEPFFTTKKVGEGTGLGLSVVHGIMRDHEGAIQVESQQGKGTTFKLYLPITEQRPEPKSDTPNQRPAAGEGRHIMYVDDDPALLELVSNLLVRQGYRVSAFIDPMTALEGLAKDPEDFQLLVTDYNMPTLSGLDVARRARILAPKLPIAVASGYINDELRGKAAVVGVDNLLFKPIAISEFALTIERLLPDSKPAAPQVPLDVPGARILVIDDHPMTAMLLVRQLERAGFEADSADSASRGLLMWKSGKYAAVLTDCNMPGLSGLDLARAIRHEEAMMGKRRTPIVACSGNETAADAAASIGAGMDAHIGKHVTPELLKQLLSGLIRGAA